MSFSRSDSRCGALWDFGILLVSLLVPEPVSRRCDPVRDPESHGGTLQRRLRSPHRGLSSRCQDGPLSGIETCERRAPGESVLEPTGDFCFLEPFKPWWGIPVFPAVMGVVPTLNLPLQLYFRVKRLKTWVQACRDELRPEEGDRLLILNILLFFAFRKWSFSLPFVSLALKNDDKKLSITLKPHQSKSLNCRYIFRIWTGLPPQFILAMSRIISVCHHDYVVFRIFGLLLVLVSTEDLTPPPPQDFSAGREKVGHQKDICSSRYRLLRLERDGGFEFLQIPLVPRRDGRALRENDIPTWRFVISAADVNLPEAFKTALASRQKWEFQPRAAFICHFMLLIFCSDAFHRRKPHVWALSVDVVMIYCKTALKPYRIRWFESRSVTFLLESWVFSH